MSQQAKSATPAMVYNVQGQGPYHLPVRAAELFPSPSWALVTQDAGLRQAE